MSYAFVSDLLVRSQSQKKMIDIALPVWLSGHTKRRLNSSRVINREHTTSRQIL
ncbi:MULTISPECIES: hypothetical protein [Cyanophyceae]|uniref:hypothetical protein n=1 Tax=Cyanophyceae TaxID=3028117 RepID=UPI0030DB6BC0